MLSEGIRPKKKLLFTSDLISWLNQESAPYYGKPTKASRARILALYNAINDTDARLSAAVESEPDRNFWQNPPKVVQDGLDEIQERLDEYPTWPHVEIIGKYGEGGLHIENATGPGRPIGEQVAAWGIMELTRNHSLHLLRQCACGRWFLAKRHDQRAHNAVCRHKLYEQTGAYKAMRREYMRRYNALKRSGKVR